MTVWLTVREVAERIGLAPKQVRELMQPDHPAAIPNTNIPRTNGNPRYRIAERDLRAWQLVHQHRPSVTAADYDEADREHDPEEDRA